MVRRARYFGGPLASLLHHVGAKHPLKYHPENVWKSMPRKCCQVMWKSSRIEVKMVPETFENSGRFSNLRCLCFLREYQVKTTFSRSGGSRNRCKFNQKSMPTWCSKKRCQINGKYAEMEPEFIEKLSQSRPKLSPKIDAEKYAPAAAPLSTLDNLATISFWKGISCRKTASKAYQV